MTALVFFLFFGVFAAGMSGTIPAYRDSGDLIASVSTLGIAHPPGYPVYVLLGRLFQMLIPFGNLSYKLNLFSAFCAAATLALLYKSLSTYSRLGAWSAILVFAMSPAFVMLARVSEMYTLAACFSAFILVLAAQKNTGAFWAGFFVLGLGLGVHPTLIFLVPALYLGPGRRGDAATGRRGDESRISKSPCRPIATSTLLPVLFFLIGSTVVLYLPVRAHTHPLFNWGDPSTWRNFWRVLTRADYGGLKLHPVESSLTWTLDSAIAQLQFFVRALAGEWGWGALLVAAGGLGVFFYRAEKKARLGGACASFLLAGPLFFLLSNLPLQEATTPAILQPYLLLPGIFITVALAYGLAQLWEGQKGLAAAALAGVFLTLPKPGWTFYAREDFLAYDYGRNLLRELPTGAVLYDPDDPTSFTIRALQVTENRRVDVIPLNFFRTRWGYEAIRRNTALLPDIPLTNAKDLEYLLWTYSRFRRPFYAELPQKFENHPYACEGLAYAAYPKDAQVSRARAEANLVIVSRRDFSQTVDHADFFAQHLVSYYAAAQCNLGLDEANAGFIELAEFHYKMALTIDPMLTVAYNNWGNLAYQRKDYKGAAVLYRAGLAINPRDAGLQANLKIALSAVGATGQN